MRIDWGRMDKEEKICEGCRGVIGGLRGLDTGGNRSG